MATAPAPTIADYQRLLDLFDELMPAAQARVREYVLARTPPQYQALMLRLVDAAAPMAARFPLADPALFDEGR